MKNLTEVEKEIIRLARLQTPERRAAIEANMVSGFVDMRLLDDDKGSADLDDEYNFSEFAFGRRQCD